MAPTSASLFTANSGQSRPQPAFPTAAKEQAATVVAPRFSPQLHFDAPARVLHGTILPSLLDEPMLELELSLAQFDGTQDFADVVSRSVHALGGAFLFDLPASGLIDNCTRIAALRLRSNGEWVTVFACLEPDRETIRIEAPDERTDHLHAFADAFVHLLERL